ncbi:MAG: heme lyase CcmF/NrfE family subunit [Candidatus Tectomicrobia bacterium]|nr:heme lyase CcmF/NrfE family subunit [Candidatus Tectomicrobia bacterium]
MVELGSSALVVAFLVAVYATVAPLLGVRRGSAVLVRSSEQAVYALFGLLTISSLCLVYLLLTRNFQVEYVASYSNRAMNPFYTVAAFWGGQKGSLLLWAWMLSIFAMVVMLQNRQRNRDLMPYIGAVMSFTTLFFIVTMLWEANPFERLNFTPPDGRGLNPLLQNPSMVFHPPTLYTGYIGFTVPFAFAIAALASGRLGSEWLKTTRRWTLFSWYFLGIGILLGAQWAYVELGWGGYWAWDPVENASFMPWLVGTAFLHSVMMQEKKEMMKVWNIVLILLTFALSIFGTFLTRSGVIASVHSFAQSNVGYYFLVFLGMVILGSLALLFYRYDELKSTNQLESFLSRESSFLFNNLIMLGATFAVFWGTMFPIISEAVRGVKVTVGPPFFNQVFVPIGLAMLLLSGIAPLIAWRKASARNLKRNFLTPLYGAAIALAFMLAFGMRHVYALVAFTIAAFVLWCIGLEFWRGTIARHEMTGESYPLALLNLIGRNKRRYGGYIVHLGMALIFIGITGSSAFTTAKEVVLAPGESAAIGDYRLRFDQAFRLNDPNYEGVGARLEVFQKGRPITSLVPEKRLYVIQQQPSTEVAVRSTLKEDLYTILAAVDEQGRASFKFIINPLVNWLWLGGLCLTFGTIVIMLPEGRKESARARRTAAAPQAVPSRATS